MCVCVCVCVCVYVCVYSSYFALKNQIGPEQQWQPETVQKGLKLSGCRFIWEDKQNSCMVMADILLFLRRTSCCV
jgi:hypothetical protein